MNAWAGFGTAQTNAGDTPGGRRKWQGVRPISARAAAPERRRTDRRIISFDLTTCLWACHGRPHGPVSAPSALSPAGRQGSLGGGTAGHPRPPAS